MDLDIQEGFDLYVSSPEPEEPEWVILNRKYITDHPWIHSQKRPMDILDSFWTCDTPSTPDSLREPSVNSDFENNKCFIDKIDLRSLVEDPDSFNIDSLFAETNTINETRKKWERSDEVKLLRFMNSSGKSSLDLWKKIAEELGRSVNSIRIKAASLRKAQNSLFCEKKTTLIGIVSQALSSFGNSGATRDEVIQKIEQSCLSVKQKQWKTSVKQILNTKFVKCPGVFRLKDEVERIEYKKCITMADYILFVVQKYGPMTKKLIKMKISEEFSKFLNVTLKGKKATWEQTFSKKFKSCKYLDWSSARTVYKVS